MPLIIGLVVGILLLLIIGGIIGLVIFLRQRKKKDFFLQDVEK